MAVIDRMDLNQRKVEAYQDNMKWFPDKALDVRHHTLGLTGEAGEVANEIKKWDRGDYYNIAGSIYPDAFKQKVASELADVLVYAFSLASILGIDLERSYDEKRDYNGSRFGNK